MIIVIITIAVITNMIMFTLLISSIASSIFVPFNLFLSLSFILSPCFFFFYYSIFSPLAFSRIPFIFIIIIIYFFIIHVFPLLSLCIILISILSDIYLEIYIYILSQR